MDIILSLGYRGARSYIQAGDIFLAIDAALANQQLGYLKKLTLNRFARNQLVITFDDPKEDNKLVGSGIMSSEIQVRKFYLVETAEPVTKRNAYDEDEVLIGAVLSNLTITNMFVNKYTVIENLIALTKKLNYQLVADVSGRWVFGQLDLSSALPRSWNRIKITRTVCIANRFSRNSIEIDGFDFGELRFIVGKP